MKFFFLLLLGWGGANFTLFAVQKTGHGLRVAETVEFLNKGNWPSSLLCRVVEPFVSMNGDAVITGETAFTAFPQKAFAPAEEKRFQVYGGGPLLLAVGKFDIGHDFLLILHIS